MRIIPRLQTLLGCLLVGLAACTASSANRGPALLTGMQIIHTSTFEKLIDNANEVAMVFADGRRAVVADNIWENSRFYLIDLEQGAVRTIHLPQPGQISLSTLIYAGDAVIALFHSTADGQDMRALRIDAEGAIRELEYQEYHTRTTAEQPLDEGFLAPLAGRLKGLTRLQEEVCTQQADGTFFVEKIGRVERFVGADLVIASNHTAMKERLARQSATTIIDSCAYRTPAAPPGYTIEFTREGQNNTGYSDMNTRLKTVRIAREGQLVAEHQFPYEAGFYFWAVPVGQRIYVVGSSVVYLDLSTLPR